MNISDIFKNMFVIMLSHPRHCSLTADVSQQEDNFIFHNADMDILSLELSLGYFFLISWLSTGAGLGLRLR